MSLYAAAVISGAHTAGLTENVPPVLVTVCPSVTQRILYVPLVEFGIAEYRSSAMADVSKATLVPLVDVVARMLLLASRSLTDAVRLNGL